MPMQKLLRGKHLFRLSSFILLILFGMTSLCAAQVSISEVKPIDIRFSLNQTTVNSSGVHISIHDLINSHGFSDQYTVDELVTYSDRIESSIFYYVSDDSRFIYPGRIQSRETDEATFFSISVTNDSDQPISSMMVAFDFIYSSAEIENAYSLSLSYRVNGNQWRNLPGSAFRMETLSELGEEWNTFSMQLNLTDIFLRNEDHLDLRWDINGLDRNQVTAVLPLAIQRMEIYPESPRFEPIHRGQLVITEILNSVEIDGMPFEYIELFNSSEKHIQLKGFELHSNDGIVVIQSELDVEPYQTVVFSNVDLSGLGTVGAHYLYQGSILRSNRGRIDLIRGGDILSRAAYESQEPGVSLELDRVANAINGYTSLQNLIPSESRVTQDIKGSPGDLTATVPLYSRTLVRKGWYFITPPGRMPERLNRHPSLQFFGLDGRSLGMDQIRPFRPMMIYKSDDTPITVYVEKIDLPNDNGKGIETINVKRSFRVSSLKTPHPTDLQFISAEGDQKMAPLVKVWDESLQRFRLMFSDHDQLNGWKPFIINSDLIAGLELNYGGYQSTSIELNRYIPIVIYEGSGNNRVQVDEAIIGFVERHSLNRGVSYDLPKLSGTFQRELSLPINSSLYLTSPESKFRTNSFVELPKEIDQSKIVGLGFDPVPGSSGPATIEWSLDFDIPDDWSIKLEDTQTGIVVDMREVNNYRFRYTSQDEENNQLTNVNGLTSYIPRDRNRFTITVEKDEPMLLSEVENDKPGSIELRQNYPNPFNPATNITFFLPEERSVRVGVYNIVGQQVSLLIDDTLQAGEHSVVWDASNNPSGIYIVQLETGNRLLTRKITLIK